MKRFMAVLCLLFVSPVIHAVDVNSVTLVGNVWSVSRTTHVGAASPIDTMTIYGDVGVEIGTYLVVSIRCPASLGCFDSWWLSTRCTVSSSTNNFTGGTLSTATCVPRSSADGTSMGSCVKISGHLSPDPQTGDNIVYPDRVDALAWWVCDTKP